MADNSTKSNRQSPEGISTWTDHLAGLDELAARSVGRDEAKVADLANAIAALFPAPNGMPASVCQDAISRFTRTELSYRKRAIEGISESNFVQAFNQFMWQISAPDYCRISRLQLAARRHTISSHIPNLLGRSTGHVAPIADSSGDSYMSPLEAEFVLLDTLNLKLRLPPEFQLTPEDWDSKYAPRISQDSGSPVGSSASGRSYKTMLVMSPLESNGLYLAVLMAKSKMGDRRLISLLGASLDAMGIER